MGEKETGPNQHRPYIKVKTSSGSEDVHYSVIYEGLPEEFKKMAERELNETDERRERCLRELKIYLEKDNLTYVNEIFMLAVLRHCKYDMKKSEKKLKTFTIARKETIKQLTEMGMEKIELIVDDMPTGALPYRDSRGSVISFTRPDGLNLDSYDLNDVMSVGKAYALFHLSFPMTTVAGFAHFGECKASSLYLVCCILDVLRRNLSFFTSFPLRAGSVEILNENYVTRCFLKLLRAVLSKKIIGRISLHGSDINSLHANYHPDILPEEFGGNMGPMTCRAYKQKFLDFIQDLINES